MLKRVVKTIRGVPISQKLLWATVILLLFLYLNLLNSMDSSMRDLRSEIYSNTSTEEDSLNDVVSRVETLENSVAAIKDESCATISRLYGLNGKFYICPLSFR